MSERPEREALAAWARDVAAEIRRLQEPSAPSGEGDVALEAALGRAYRAVHAEGARIKAEARAEAKRILADAHRKAAVSRSSRAP